MSTRLSQVQRFAELLLKDPELRDATAQQMEWLKVVDANGGAVGRGIGMGQPATRGSHTHGRLLRMVLPEIRVSSRSQAPV